MFSSWKERRNQKLQKKRRKEELRKELRELLDEDKKDDSMTGWQFIKICCALGFLFWLFSKYHWAEIYLGTIGIVLLLISAVIG